MQLVVEKRPLNGPLSCVYMTTKSSVKAKFHYASWFGVGSESVRNRFGAGSEVVRSWFGDGCEPVQSWFELKFGMSSSLLAAN